MNKGEPLHLIASFAMMWCSIIVFWSLGPEKFPDFNNYILLAKYNYTYLTEVLSNKFLTSSLLSDEATSRVIYYTIFVQIFFICFFSMFYVLNMNYSLFAAYFIAYYGTFLMTTAIRASLAYLLAGFLLAVYLRNKQYKLAFVSVLIASLFHDSALFVLLVLTTTFLFQKWIYWCRSAIIFAIGLTISLSIFFTIVGFERIDVQSEIRFVAYLNSELNSIVKLIFISLHLILLYFLNKNVSTDSFTTSYVLVGTFIIAACTIINHVVAIRLLIFLFPIGMLQLSFLVRKKFTDSKVLTLPFVIVFGAFNSSALL